MLSDWGGGSWDLQAKQRYNFTRYCSGAAGDFIEDDDGTGYAGSEEDEDDWESGVQRAPPAVAAAESKKRKGNAGSCKGTLLFYASAAEDSSET